MQFRPAASYSPGKDLVCQVTDWHAEDTDDADTEDVPEVKTRYIVTAYAVTKEGWSVSIKVTGFCPFFFVELPEAFESKSLNSLLGAARGLVKPTSAAAIKHTKIVQRRKLAPFDNGKMHRFLEISFLNKNAFYDYARAFGGGSIGVTGAGVVKLEPCESNIDPLLRMIHCRDLQPAGWVRIPKNKHYRPDHDRSTCQISCQTDYRFLRPHEQPTIAPILMASFDIEADSSMAIFRWRRKTTGNWPWISSSTSISAPRRMQRPLQTSSHRPSWETQITACSASMPRGCPRMCSWRPHAGTSRTIPF